MMINKSAAVGGVGWLGAVGGVMKMVYDHFHVSSIEALQTQYTMSLEIIARACGL